MDDGSLCMLDYDGDFYGDDAPSASSVTAGTDCDDSSNDVYPMAAEVCDTIDNDCDGDVDANDSDFAVTDETSWYPDNDEDNKETQVHHQQSCLSFKPPVGYVDNNDDCDDNDDTNQCGLNVDNDGDGVTVATDCDDNDPDVNPNEFEVCDGKDNNCVGGIDENPIDAVSFYRDDDEDGLGDENQSESGCSSDDLNASMSWVASSDMDGFDCDPFNYSDCSYQQGQYS